MRITCPHCKKEFKVFLKVDHAIPEDPEYLKTAKFIVHELERRKLPCLTLKTLAKRCGYKRANNSEFRKALKHLVKEGLIKIHRSGSPSDSLHHAYVACLVESEV